jgi:hypothetical protein
MKTRSQTKSETKTITIITEPRQLFEVNIDFDAASEAWRANKKSIGNGSYKYLCAKVSKNNNCCANKCLHGEDYCKTHLKMFNEGKI